MSWFSKGEKAVIVFLCSLALVGAGIKLLLKFNSDKVIIPTESASKNLENLNKRQKSAESPINLNKASAARLTRLKGVGPALAKKIVDERKSGGPFTSAADLAGRVNGLGETTAFSWGDNAEY